MSELIAWCGGDHPTVEPMTPIRPHYRGPADPSKVRIACAPAVRLDWSHDGGPDDIVAYEVATDL